MLDLEDHVADLGRGLGEQVADLAADHLRDDLVDRGVGDRVGGDVGAVAHHRDGVAQREDLVEAVGDEHQRPALVAQAAGDGEEPLDLDAAERGGGLVHDQQAGVERDGLRDLDDLLVGDREAQGGAPGVDVHAEPVEELLGLGVHRRPVDPAAAAERLAAHEDVLGDRQVREQRRLLVDHRDAGRLGRGGRAEVDVLAVEAEHAPVALVHAGDDLDQRRLAGAVLADQRVDRATVDRQAAGGQGHHGSEGLGDVAQLESRVVASASVHQISLIERFQFLRQNLGDGNHSRQGLVRNSPHPVWQDLPGRPGGWGFDRFSWRRWSAWRSTPTDSDRAARAATPP